MKRISIIVFIVITMLVFMVSCNETPSNTEDSNDNEITEATGNVNTGTNETLGADPEKEITVICQCENCNKKTIDSATAIIIAQTNFSMLHKEELDDIWWYFSFEIENENDRIITSILETSEELEEGANINDYWVICVWKRDASGEGLLQGALGGNSYAYVINKATGEIVDLVVFVGD